MTTPPMIGNLLRWKSRQSRPAGWIRLAALASGMDAAADLVAFLQRLEELVLVHGLRRRLERKLRGGRLRRHEQKRQRETKRA